MDSEISSSFTNEQIQVIPSELRFPYLQNAKLIASCSVKLVNVTDNSVVFVPRYKSKDVAVYETYPYGLILPPRSTHEILVSREAKKSIAESIQCDDKYILHSTTVRESFGNSEYGSDLDKFYEKQPSQTWHAVELPVFLEPAYQSGPLDNMPHSKVLIQVDPHELCFPFTADESITITSSIKVVNITNKYIIFLQRYKDSNVAEYTMRPSDGILPPRSTQDIVVRRTIKNKVLQSIECNDTNFLFSTVVSKDFKSDNLPKFYETKAGIIWHKLELGVRLEVQTQLPKSNVMSSTDISSSVTNELIQAIPSELRFPYLQNAILIASCSVKLVNVTDNPVVFVPRYKSKDVAVYETYPYGLILPPRSTHEILVSREAKKSIAESIQCDDKYILHSTTVRESFANSEYGSDLDKFYENQPGQTWHAVELPVFLEPAYQQGSPDNMPHTEVLIQVDPHELCFPFTADESLTITSSIKVVNITNKYIIFLQRYKDSNVAEYTMRPSDGILPPRSTQDIMVRRTIKNKVLQSIECNDTNFLFSTVVSKDFKSDNLPKFYETKAGIIWHKLELGVHLEVQTQLPKSNVMPSRDAGSPLHHMSLQYLTGITNNFCKERILGTGGFGEVYKGVLGNGKMVAVKKLVQSMSSSLEQFENEIKLLRKLKHPNIVQLVGYCYETQHLHNHHEGKSIFALKTECLLCLEFLPKGSLDKYISDASSGLDWPTRLKVIEGVSYGLQHLHEQPEGPIIHLDLKPANILIDVNMAPKITDFGLSRMFDKNTIQTKIMSGTLGYMPPEYVRGIITPMSDIFSLGVIIMEVITGHRDYPYDIRESSMEFIELELQKWRNVMQKEPVYTSLEIYCQQITRCIQIGLICVNPERTKRPTAKKIIDMLQGLESMDWYISNELSIQPQHPGGAAVI